MSKTLFEITNEFQTLYEIASSDEDPRALMDTIEAMMPEVEQKAAGYVAVIQQLDMEAKRAKELAEMFKAKQTVRENNIKHMKVALMQAMDAMKVTEISAGAFTIKLAKNGGKQPMIIDGEVPDNFKRIIYEDDKELIRKHLEDGEVLNFAKLLPRGEHISIK